VSGPTAILLLGLGSCRETHSPCQGAMFEMIEHVL
jgi:hypothetical protein